MKIDVGYLTAGVLGTALLFGGCQAATQPDPPQNCQYRLAPAELAPCMRGTQVTVAITTSAGCPWTATTGASWLTVSSSSRTGAGTLFVAVADNWNAPRNAVVTVRHPTATTGQDLKVSQAGCYYAVTQSSFAFSAASGGGSFDVVTMADPNTCGGALQNGCAWTAEANGAWLRITTSMPQSGDQTVRFTVDPNTTGAVREATISVRDKVVRVTQAAS